jgi:hypothetical protein
MVSERRITKTKQVKTTWNYKRIRKIQTGMSSEHQEGDYEAGTGMVQRHVTNDSMKILSDQKVKKRNRKLIKSGLKFTRSWDSSAVYRWARGWMIGGVRVPVGAGNFSRHHRVQTGSGAHPASYTMGTRGPFPRGKAARASSWPLTSI